MDYLSTNSIRKIETLDDDWINLSDLVSQLEFNPEITVNQLKEQLSQGHALIRFVNSEVTQGGV